MSRLCWPSNWAAPASTIDASGLIPAMRCGNPGLSESVPIRRQAPRPGRAASEAARWAGFHDSPNRSEWAISAGMDRFGRIDTLVNNAGIFIAKPFTQYTEADYAAILGVNVAGFFHITQLAIAEMEKQRSGHVVQISTSLVDHAMTGVPSVLASLTKGGLNAATKSLAIEYAKSGIRVNAVALGVIKSPMHPVETHAQLDRLHPVAHMGEIADVVDAILYLESAGFVTGEILHVDGGQSAGH